MQQLVLSLASWLTQVLKKPATQKRGRRYYFSTPDSRSCLSLAFRSLYVPYVGKGKLIQIGKNEREKKAPGYSLIFFSCPSFAPREGGGRIPKMEETPYGRNKSWPAACAVRFGLQGQDYAWLCLLLASLGRAVFRTAAADARFRCLADLVYRIVFCKTWPLMECWDVDRQ